MENYINIGYTKKAYGVKGEVKLHIEAKYLEDFLQCDIAFIEMEGKQVPYFIEYIKPSFPLVGKFEDINTREQALDIVAQKIFLRTSDLIPEADKTFIVEETLQYKKYEGFQIIDRQLGLIGTIQSVVEYPQQEMAVTKYKQKEILIPLNEQLIVHIDEEQKTIEFILPEGLLDL